jgi:hypothetical protein
MVDINNLFGINQAPDAEPEAEPVVVAETPVAEPVVAPAAAPVVAPAAAPVAAVTKVQDRGGDFEALPGIWNIALTITHSFTLPDGTWVRPVQSGGETRAAVPAKWVEHVRSL